MVAKRVKNSRWCMQRSCGQRIKGVFYLFLMKPNVLSWNVRGLNDRDKSLKIRGLIRDWKGLLFVYSKLSWRLFLQLWWVVYGVVNMCIGVIWGREGRLEEFG
jgi:hypothetical protein